LGESYNGGLHRYRPISNHRSLDCRQSFVVYGGWLPGTPGYLEALRRLQRSTRDSIDVLPVGSARKTLSVEHMQRELYSTQPGGHAGHAEGKYHRRVEEATPPPAVAWQVEAP